MAPEPLPVADVMNRAHSRREPVPLEQIPVWDGFVPDAPVTDGGDPPAGLDALLGGLNTEQLKAVTHGEGPLLVVAGAGTGKTQVITRRIAWLIATRRATPAQILALTFTEKAAAEMQARVDQLVPYGYTDAAIGTFHAFGDRIIREYALELGLPTDVRVLSRPEVVIFLREHLFEFALDEYRPLGDPTRFLGALATLFSRSKDEDVSPAAYLEHVAALAARAAAAPDAEALAEEARRQGELARAYARYQDLLAANGFIDFGDQVSLALRLVRTSAAARAELQSRFRYILVDEFQDTNSAQSELVSILAEPHRNITVVGDDDQSIYKFRGAAISNILGFRDRYRTSRTVVLRRNYRSLAPILDASYRLVRFNDPERLEVRAGISKRLRPQRDPAEPGPPVRLEAFASHAEEADWVAAEIGRRIAAGARPRDIAVLVRANGHADPILRSLNVAGIPWRFSGTSGLYARPEVRQLLAFLRAVSDLSSSVDVYALAASESYGLGGEDLTSIVTTARRRHRSVWEVLEELERQPGILRLSAATRTAAARLVGDLRRFSQLAHERPAGEVLYAFLRDTGTLGRLAASDTVAAEEALRNIARFFDIVRAQSALLADDRATFVARHLETLIEAGDDPPTADLDPDADAVAVLTVHKAKGLEFPVVFMPGLVAGRFPTHSRREPLSLPLDLVREILPEGDVQLQEERRLFYVGMTRARDELILSHAADYGGGIARRLSPFVLEALDLPAVGPTGGTGTAASPALERIGTFEPRQPEPEVRRGPVEEPLMLSFYAVDDYLTCPLKFKYGHVLRVPLAPHHALIYGSALHKAVQEFHRRHARGEVMSDEELAAAFELAWSNEGFVTREHEEARLAAGRDALRRFRLEQLKPDAVIPAYVERDFSFSLDGDRMRGRWDRVDIEPADDAGDAVAEPSSPHADTVSPTLGLTGRERVTITDYKSSDVRDPVKARQRARESLQLQIYAMGYEALTGRLPDYLQLHFLDSGLVGRVEVDPKRLAKARRKIASAAAGIRARDYTPKPDRISCSYCPFRAICPSSVAT
ncbi:MAG TPA: ATP-dependent DNA helicase [Candidatus Limnocylindrales bacterium]|jgi:DNA helicase-2/ATP-dependent DNA helicase PcrA|nr:ATP-dependent DNA helicase [Candidatus Limnocylindrales bacterium]